MHKFVTALIVLLSLSAAFVIGILVTDYLSTRTDNTPELTVIIREPVAENLQTEHGEALFTIDDGMRLDYASNPMVMDYDGMNVTLAYEDRAEDLKSAPGITAPVAYSEDGLTFTTTEEQRHSIKSRPVQTSDGTYRRFVYEPENGGLLAQVSEDGETYEQQEVVAFPVETGGENDVHTFGVYTYFVDTHGNIVLLFNKTDEDGAIVIDRAVATEEDDWETFTLEEQDIFDGTLESEVYADPNAIVLEDGEVWLVIMNQDQDQPAPPLGRQGRVHAYVSQDGGDTFEYWGHLFSYDDVTEFEVYSLNDPKIVEHNDGTLRIYIAAMIEDDEVEVEDETKEYKYIMISASYNQ